jgi:hypothetical protein
LALVDRLPRFREALYRDIWRSKTPVSLACQAGLETWLCATFRSVIILFNPPVRLDRAGGALVNLAAIDRTGF